MWDDVGIIRDGDGLERGLARLEGMETELLASGIADRNRGFNLTWHDWLNLRSQIEFSKVIALAAMQRETSAAPTTATTSRSPAISKRRPARSCARRPAS